MAGETISGIHHITAIASDAQRNLDFYAGLLGMRLVKRTINFDDPGTYHFYFGDELGRPGTLLTFFPWSGMPRGHRGAGEVTAIAFAIPDTALDYWRARLESHGIAHRASRSGLDAGAIAFVDPDGLELELVSSSEAGSIAGWAGGPAPAEAAVRGVHAATIAVGDPGRTSELLTEVMGFRELGRVDARTRFRSEAGGLGSIVDLVTEPAARGRMGAGSVHHIAWRAVDDAAQARWRTRVVEWGLFPTEVLDRQYFHSIYFREPGGVLFEIATDPPGFTTDETPDRLGTSLKLPPWLEQNLSAIERALPVLEPPKAGRA
jgi:glyoxalase family protein